MDDLTVQLNVAACHGDTAALQAALTAGADPSAADEHGWTPLHRACIDGHLACTQALLAAGANPNAAAGGMTALQFAAGKGHTPCMAALLAAGADPAAGGRAGFNVLHYAARTGNVETYLALLAAAPQLALARNNYGQLPLHWALIRRRWDAARCLLEHGPLLPPGELLELMDTYRGDMPLSLYAPLVARQPLTPAQWARVPSPCPGLGAALPAVLARSEAEAGQLVRRLPAADRERLRTAALCIRRVERRRRLSLPTELLRPLLLAAVG